MAAAPPLHSAHAGIDLWLTPYRDISDPHLLARYRALLEPCERTQALRFHFADDRHRYLVTRALVRTVLSRYVPIEPASWRFIANDHGRPQIHPVHDAARGLTFNLSHTAGLIALAVGWHRCIGVDVENTGSRAAALEVADRFFGPRERAAMTLLSAPQREQRFYECWTFKEAYLKARGVGLSAPLDALQFHYPDERSVCMTLDPSLQDHPGRWQLWQFRPDVDLVLALCVQRLIEEPTSLTIRNIVPLHDECPLRLAATRISWQVDGEEY